jgi:putative alpha-1,2-mannosidase
MGNEKFVITANNLSDKNFYIQSIKLNGKDHPYSFIKHSDNYERRYVSFEMGSKPSKWGSEISSRPVSLINIPFVPVPFLTSGERVFRDSIAVRNINHRQRSQSILYT